MSITVNIKKKKFIINVATYCLLIYLLVNKICDLNRCVIPSKAKSLHEQYFFV